MSAESGTAPTGALLRGRRLSKAYPGVQALDAVDLEVHAGEVLAVVGENGAGKSTLMKILAGIQRADRGEVQIEGLTLPPGDLHAAQAARVFLIHQELVLCDNLSIASNVALGREPRRGLFRDERAITELARQACRRVGLDADPETPVGELSIGQQQQVEIAKALAAEARVLIMDEPTSSLSERETLQLLQLIRGLRSQGVAIIYISHRLREVCELADRVLVLRDGQRVAELGADELDPDRMVEAMVGRSLDRLFPPRQVEPGPVRLAVQGLRTAAWPAATVDLQVRAGEVIGLAGLVGAGRSELLETLAGLRRRLGGEIQVAGQRLRRDDPRHAIHHGLMLVPEDRKRVGLALQASIRDNWILPSLAQLSSRLGLIDSSAGRQLCARGIQAQDVRAAGMEQRVGDLSGGNQQKVVLGKWISRGPQVLLLDEPTRGVDVGAKAEIYEIIAQLAADGLAVLFASSDMEEVLGLADRILVLREGVVQGLVERAEFREETVLGLATGHAQGEHLPA